MSARALCYCALILVMGMGLAGKIEADTEEAIAREAPLWSSKCERAGKQMVAHKADSGKWVVHCVNATVKL